MSRYQQERWRRQRRLRLGAMLLVYGLELAALGCLALCLVPLLAGWVR